MARLIFNTPEDGVTIQPNATVTLCEIDSGNLSRIRIIIYTKIAEPTITGNQIMVRLDYIIPHKANSQHIHTHNNGRISKQGSPWLRWILVQCAMTAVRYEQRLKSFYERLKSKKGSAKAIIATAKEILVIIWYMLTRRELYRRVNKKRYEQKLSRLKKIKELAIYCTA
jgi:hypothetical protein